MPTKQELEKFQSNLSRTGEGYYWAFQNVMSDEPSKKIFLTYWSTYRKGSGDCDDMFFGKFISYYMKRIIV